MIYRNLVILFGSIIFSSCIQQDLSSYGKISYYNSLNKKVFSYSVNEEFLKRYAYSKPDKTYPIMSRDEARLLNSLLKSNNDCVRKNGKTVFKRISKQDKVYDVTFSNLIEKNYNAKPTTPITYFGECM